MLPSAVQPIIHNHRHNLRHRFELIKTLGEGTYGKVKLAVEVATGEKVAIKYIRKKKIEDDHDLNRIRREIQVMAKLQHPHIINVREVFENKEKIVMVMDYASGGELYDYINSKKRLDERDARRIFRQIVSAVHYCHQNHVVHRDLKLENIVLDDNGNVRIADFGLSNFYGGSVMLTTFCGSPLYASPEIVNGVPYKGPEVDCWSLGVLLYTLVYGAMPFDGADFKTLKKQISMGDYYEPHQTSESASLIGQLLNPNPEKRATMEKLLNHWWVNMGFSTTPSGAPYTGPCVHTAGPHFSFLNFFFNGDLENNTVNYGAKYSHSSGGSIGRRFRGRFEERESDDFNHNANASATHEHEAEIGPRESRTSNDSPTKMSVVSSDGVDSGSCSDSLSNQSTEEAKMFDLEKKPARSILKKRGKFSGSDSGCGLEEALATSSGHTSPVNGATSPVSGTTSPIDGAASSGHASPVNENTSSDLSYDLCDIETVLDKGDAKHIDYVTVPEYENGKIDSINGNNGVTLSPEHTQKWRGKDLTSKACKGCSGQRISEIKDRLLIQAGIHDSKTSPVNSELSKPAMSVRRGILKRPKRHNQASNEREQKKRNSTGSSQGSNSSGDLLDFSYDSVDGEQLMSKFYLSRKSIKLQCADTSVGDSDMSSCRTRLRTLSVSDEDFFCKKAAFLCEETAMFDMDEARDICHQAIQICSGKGF